MTDKLLDEISPYIQEAIKLGANEVELYAQRIREKSAKIASNKLESATGLNVEGLGVRILIDNSMGFASVNSLEPEKVHTIIKKAISISQSSPSTEYYKLGDPQQIHPISALFDPTIENLSVDNVIEYTRNSLIAAKEYDERITIDTGTFTTSVIESAIATSTGIVNQEKKSLAQLFLFGWAVEGDDIGSFEYDFDAVVKISEMNVKEVAKRFAERAINNLGAVKTESFEGVAVFSPDSMYELLYYFMNSVTAAAIQSGSSYLSDRLGEEVFDPSISIIDDGTIENAVGSSSFDREGTPHKKYPIFEKGVFKGILYDTFTAKKENLISTGHAVGRFRNAPSISITNIDICAGTSPLDELLADIKHGLFVTRISAFPNPVSGDFSGPVKGGLLIKNGQITDTLKEITITGNLYEGLRNILALSKERKLIRYQSEYTPFEPHSYHLPYFVIDGMKFAT